MGVHHWGTGRGGCSHAIPYARECPHPPPPGALGIWDQGAPFKVPCPARLWAWLSAAGDSSTCLQRQQQLQRGQDQSKHSIRSDKAEPLWKQAPFLQPTFPWDTCTHVPRVRRELVVPCCWLNPLHNENFFLSELLLKEEEASRPQCTAHRSVVGSQAPKKGWESPSLRGKMG